MGRVKTLLHSVYDQPDAVGVQAQFDRIIEALENKLPAVAAHLEGARADVLAFTSFPKAIWRQIWSNNPNVICSRPGGVLDVRDGRLGRLIVRAGSGYLHPSSTLVLGRSGVRCAGSWGGVAA